MDFFQEAVTSLGIKNEIITFEFAKEAIEYLMDTTAQPFVIISDVNLPGISGMEFQLKIQENEYLKKKAIPFIFLSTDSNPKRIENAYDLKAQGYFVKSNNFIKATEIVKRILFYWEECKHPFAPKLLF